ncbi:MAG: hypothetical protein L0229_27780 [Blastocatellia bacterium]|nr:hypothetical protein [Blastocatellia bacterium]
MTANTDAADSNGPESGAAEEVRQAFSALPFNERLSTLVKVELDLLGDAAKTIVEAASKVADEIVEAVAGPEPSPTSKPEAGEQASTN